jgi:hypothetical protein
VGAAPFFLNLASQFYFLYLPNLFPDYSGQLQGNQDIDLTRFDRTFFLKLSYILGI